MTVGNTKAWVDTKTNGQKELSLAGHTHSYAASTHTHTKAQITDFPTTMTPSAHSHSASDVTSGTLPIARGGTGGTTAETARNALGAAAATHTHYDLANKTHNHSNESLNPASIELKGSSVHGGYIDFHYGGTTDDYTSRIIEEANGVVKLNDGIILTDKNISIYGNFGTGSVLVKNNTYDGSFTFTHTSTINGIYIFGKYYAYSPKTTLPSMDFDFLTDPFFLDIAYFKEVCETGRVYRASMSSSWCTVTLASDEKSLTIAGLSDIGVTDQDTYYLYYMIW